MLKQAEIIMKVDDSKKLYWKRIGNAWEVGQPRSEDARSTEGSRNIGIDIASVIVLAFDPVDLWISPRDQSCHQTSDKRIITKNRQWSKLIWNNNAQIYSSRLSDLL